MDDSNKHSEELIEELNKMRARVAELERASLEHSYLLEESERKTRELSGLHRIALATRNQQDPEVLLLELYHAVQELLSPDTFVVVRYEPEDDALQVTMAMEEGQEIPGGSNLRLPVSEGGLTGWVIRNRTPLLFGDLLHDPLPTTPRHGARAARSWLCVPLLVRDSIIGAVSIQSFTPHRYTAAEQRFLEAASMQVAVALQNTYSFEAAERRAAELEIIRQAALQLTGSLELKAVLEAVLDAAVHLIGNIIAAHIFLYENDTLTFGAALDQAGIRNIAYSEPRHDGLTYTVARQGQDILVEDISQHPLYTNAPASWRGAIAGLPLKIGERVVGVMNVAWPETQPIREQELRLLRLLADHAAIAIENARLFNAAGQRATELEVIRRASLSLTSSLDLESVLDFILEAVAQLSRNTRDAHIFLYDGQALAFGAARWADSYEGKRTPFANPRPEGLTHLVARSGREMWVEDMRSHPLYVGAPADWNGALIGLPLKIGQRVVGVMNISYPERHAFNEGEIKSLRLLADHAAIAIENARLHDLVAQQARTDALTGLPNRRAFDERIESEVQRATRYQRPVALLMMDLDGFKLVNDTYGHPVGDQVLQQIAGRLVKEIRGSDFLARYGGDEFGLLLPESDRTAAQEVAAKFTRLVNEYILDVGMVQAQPVSLSVGVAIFPDDAKSSSTLLEVADRALYRAKRRAPRTFDRVSLS